MKNTVKIAAAAVAFIMCLSAYACSPAVNVPVTTANVPVAAAEQTETQSVALTEAVTEAHFTLTENGGTALVKTDDTVYTASGYESVNADKFRIKSGFSAEFDKEFEEFNRVTLNYTASAPMKITVSYGIRTVRHEEQFFIEAAESGEFSFVIAYYFDADLASGKITVSAETCTGEEADLMIFGIRPHEIPYSNKTVRYIESSRYKLGVKLNWGGAVSYLEDKTANIDGLTNLINCHDTGRLLQQSYYGTYGNDEFTPGTSFGVGWRYNPVQGGDQYGHESRLIDFVESENSIYVKSQPLDWAKTNYLTPFYMDNTYTVTDEYVRVDNRFVDFSGWDHPVAGQELPALYTVSYLSDFVYYAGENSWCDDTLTYKTDLPFWGPNPRETSFFMKGENTETWGAFFNPDDDFGIGLYTPNIDKLTGGRNAYNGSKSASNDSTNYIGASNEMKIVSYEPIEYGYLIATGSVEEIRAVFKANRDFTDNACFDKRTPHRLGDVIEGELLLTFEEENGYVALMEGRHNTEVSYSEKEKAAVITCKGDDPHLAIIYTSVFEAQDRRHIEFEYMLPKENGRDSYTTELFLCSGDTPEPQAGKSVTVDLIKDGGYHTASVDLTNVPFWSGEVYKIRFDYFTGGNVGDVMYVRSFKLLP